MSTSSFAAYASQFINRNATMNDTTTDTSDPIFFSFTSDGSNEDGRDNGYGGRSYGNGRNGGYGYGYGYSGFGGSLFGFQRRALGERGRGGGGGGGGEVEEQQQEGYDLDDPHFMMSAGSAGSVESAGSADSTKSRESRGFLADVGEHDDDDDDEGQVRREIDEERIEREQSPQLPSTSGGWLAHQGQAYSYHSGSNSSSEEEEELLPSGLIVSGLRTSRKLEPQAKAKVPSPPPPPTLVNNNLTESLLDLDTLDRSTWLDRFNLPDPSLLPTLNTRQSQNQKEKIYNDSVWITLWLASLCGCYIGLVFFTSPSPSSPAPPNTSTLLLILLLPSILVLLSALLSYTHILFLRIWLRPVILFRASRTIRASGVLGALGTLGKLVISLLFVGSMVWIGLWVWSIESSLILVGELQAFSLTIYLFYLFYLFYQIYSLYTLYSKPPPNLPTPNLLTTLTQTELILSLVSKILLSNPFLMVLSPLLLFIALVGSIPFAVGVLRLVGEEGQLSILAIFIVWLWSWGVIRGVLRVTTAAVVGAWYFGVSWVRIGDGDGDEEGGDEDERDEEEGELEPPSNLLHPLLPRPRPLSLPPSSFSTKTLHASFHRSTHTSLGSIIISSLILSLMKTLTKAFVFGVGFFLRGYGVGWVSWVGAVVLRFWSSIPLPVPLLRTIYTAWSTTSHLRSLSFNLIQKPILHILTSAAHSLERTSTKYNGYTLIYVGLTGNGFWVSLRRAGRVSMGTTTAVGRGTPPSSLPFSTLTTPLLFLPLPFAYISYLFVLHILSPSPPTASLSALLTAFFTLLTTSLVIIFCMGLVEDVRDALWVCYCLDCVERKERRGVAAGQTEDREDRQGGNTNTRGGEGERDTQHTRRKSRKQLVAYAFEYSMNVQRREHQRQQRQRRWRWRWQRQEGEEWEWDEEQEQEQEEGWEEELGKEDGTRGTRGTQGTQGTQVPPPPRTRLGMGPRIQKSHRTQPLPTQGGSSYPYHDGGSALSPVSPVSPPKFLNSPESPESADAVESPDSPDSLEIRGLQGSLVF
ncbi:hypothetical protein J3R30DRAFT_951541 [Lentinula aciculospora]|uniref:Uncharacterized protein n=1 Tax=Lentinula aciculospora TaxID=153920 RepID=A0A9W9DWJ5_9AGAR|nr:hypothetical protein J3R30DRAFT_951541 [Lentinula aciculospora]